jgi:hypothetical protein
VGHVPAESESDADMGQHILGKKVLSRGNHDGNASLMSKVMWKRVALERGAHSCVVSVLHLRLKPVRRCFGKSLLCSRFIAWRANE